MKKIVSIIDNPLREGMPSQIKMASRLRLWPLVEDEHLKQLFYEHNNITKNCKI